MNVNFDTYMYVNLMFIPRVLAYQREDIKEDIKASFVLRSTTGLIRCIRLI